ncbi:retron St85 family RNA-directed DNA polymerase [Methylotenera sp. 1P/1]|uniref:retron St85 family RNA-directed DNA polymerase n=1 Tax=Methylotenera sp. 1P/1 TaxID=1131551 RepID=UPI000379DF65|nr:retron St85 family RNA-directed DNA polymerase [Methylotenera sp. 1P/1]
MKLITAIQNDLPLSISEIQLLLLSAPHRYKVHEIQKRHNRGTRVIAQPTSEIKVLQRWATTNILAKLPIHSAATAYVAESNTKKHAQAHAKNRYLLKLDFKDFFPSIKADDYLQHLIKYAKIDIDDARLLCRLLFWRDRVSNSLKLSIGAPSSPMVSNTVMYDFDTFVSEFCLKIEVVYTRYADDLAFSTDNPKVLESVHEFIITLCKNLPYPNLQLNEEKTVFVSKKHKRYLTGLVLTNDGKPSVGRDKKRQIRAMVNTYANGNMPDDELNRLRGLIAYAHGIDEKFIDSLIRMVGTENYNKLISGR